MSSNTSKTDLTASLRLWLPHQRWFSAKGHTIDELRILCSTPLHHDSTVTIEHIVVEVAINGLCASHMYQVFIGYRSTIEDYLIPWVIASPAEDSPDSYFLYDALYDRDCISLLSGMFAQQDNYDSLHFHTVPGHLFTEKMSGHVLTFEQSNTAIVLGYKIFLKFFRRLDYGINPDLEVHRALTRVDCDAICPLQGWIHIQLPTSGDAADTHSREEITLAIALSFVENAVDGWEMALSSVRDLLAEEDLSAQDLGTDFARESKRLGETTARMHQDLAVAFGSESEIVDIAVRVDKIRHSYNEALLLIPELSHHRNEVESLLLQACQEANEHLHHSPVPHLFLIQTRIHGDLHLGQTLRTLEKWLIIDFEGEPLKKIIERRQIDSPLRDIAGIIRSFDYVAFHQVLENDSIDTQLEFHAREWSSRNIAAFMRGYGEELNVDPWALSTFLAALLLEKALYEAVYEIHHRPTWLPIPLHAIDRIVGKGKSHLGSSAVNDLEDI